MIDESLDPSEDSVREMGRAVTEFVADYYGSIRDVPIMPVTTSEDVRAQLSKELPVDGASFESLLRVVDESIFRLSRHNGHPRFFGYVASPGTAPAAYADLLASTLNPTVTSWRSAPAAAELERITIDWIKQILAYPESAIGLYVSGGSMANLSALAVAREAASATSAMKTGLHNRSGAAELRLYTSREAHHSSAKAAALLGIGYNNVRPVRVNAKREMDIAHLVEMIESDIRQGYRPFCVVGSAGTTITGAVDPLNEIADVAFRHGLWFHVDACYGGFAALSPSIRKQFAGLERADSVALDPHKWLYVPGDCGCVLYRDPGKARATFGHEADYIRVIGQESAESFAFWDYGPELTRRFRALKVWMMFAHAGTRVLAKAIEDNCDRASYAGELIDGADDLELLAPVGLSVFCFRYLPEEFRREAPDVTEQRDAGLNEFNERLIAVLQRNGSSYLSNADLDGRFALRGCVLNYRTTRADIETLLEDVRAAAREIA